METRKERQWIVVGFDVFGMRRHDHFHEIFGRAVAALAFDEDFVNLAIVQIADRSFDQIALFINFRGGVRLQGQATDLFPQTLKIFVVAFDFRLGPLRTGCPND